MNKQVEREVFSRCAETCPAVDAAINDMLSDLGHYIAAANENDVNAIVEFMRQAIKDNGTERLRDALRECVSDRLDLESEVALLNREISDLRDRVSDMEAS